MPKNIPGIVKRNRRRPPEKVRIVVQPNPYPLEQPGGQANVSGPMNPQMQQGMPPNGYDPMNPQMQPNGPIPINPQMQQGMQANGSMPMNPQMQQGMQANGSIPLNPQMQQGGPVPMTPPLPSAPGQVVPMQSNGQWRGDPNGQPRGSGQGWQGGPGGPNGMPQQQSPTPYHNQPWGANVAPTTPPQMPAPSINPSQGRHTPPPASNVPSQPLSQPGMTPTPQRYPSQPIPNPQYSPVMGATPAAAPPNAAPRTPGNSGLLGRPGPASLSGIADAPTMSAPLPHIFIEIDGKMVQEVRLNKPVLTVGRQDGRDIQIKHQSVSRTHARIINERGNWFVEDAGSVNGIVYNGQRVKRTAINNGDRIFVAPNIALLYRVM